MTWDAKRSGDLILGGRARGSGIRSNVRARGLEPPPLSGPGPKPGAYANFATPASPSDLGFYLIRGRLVARTSARQIADRLGLDPTPVGEAWRARRERGLAVLGREKGPAGRFGLSVYQLGRVTGLTVVSPCRADPRMVSPTLVERVLAEPAMVKSSTSQPDAGTTTPAVACPDGGWPDVSWVHLRRRLSALLVSSPNVRLSGWPGVPSK
jgi:hypothetical protein